jgi:predicted nucleotidyltransferase
MQWKQPDFPREVWTMDIHKIAETLEALKPELRRVYHVERIGVFGSYARGEAGPASDVDILVEFDGPIDLFKFVELERLLTEALGIKVDLVSRKALKPFIGRVILDEVVYL